MMLNKYIFGWKEWVSLPDLSTSVILAKLDTGARTSSLHTVHEKVFLKDGVKWIRFCIALDSDEKKTVVAEAPLLETRNVTNSGGQTEERFVIKTKLCIGRWQNLAEVTLTRRKGMKCQILIGRTALSGLAIIDPEHTFLHPHIECE